MTESHTPAYKIFHYKFNFAIPGIHFYSQEYLDFVGIETTGNLKDDKAILSNYIPTRGTVMEIARHFALDHPVKLENPRDAVSMYESVRDHLENWKRALATESNLPDTPVDDLRILDEFATSIYEIARRYVPQIREKVSIATKLRAHGGGGGGLLRRGTSGSVVGTTVEAPKPLPVHNPMIEIIEDYYAHRS